MPVTFLTKDDISDMLREFEQLKQDFKSVQQMVSSMQRDVNTLTELVRQQIRKKRLYRNY